MVTGINLPVGRFAQKLAERRANARRDNIGVERQRPAALPMGTPLLFETLEPRLLLAADPLGITAGYAFDEVSGTTAADASGHGIVGTLTNGPTYTAGKYGNALTLDGVNDYVNLGNPTALQLTGSMTISAWINSSSFPVDDAAIVSKRGPTGGFQLDTTIDEGARTIGFSSPTVPVRRWRGTVRRHCSRTPGTTSRASTMPRRKP